MNYSNIKLFDIANGAGVRTSLFVSGCRRHCDGCFNRVAWNFDDGDAFDDEDMGLILETLNSKYIDGLSILGGEPLEPENQKCVLKIISEVKNRFPTKDIWLWTGFTWEELMTDLSNKTLADILNSIDVLVDGPFEIDKKDLTLRFRGSSNQRIINVKESLKNDEIVLWDDGPIFNNHKSR